jgi:pilus assembly protein CpaB
MRAVTISLDTSAIVDGLIRPGQFVDVHFSPTSLQSDPRMRGGMTMTLFRGVKIIAINRSTSQSGVGSSRNGENTVTLEMSEGQENIILVARDKGSLYCSYNPEGRGANELALTGKDRATLEEILGLEPLPKPEPPPAPPVPFVTQIFRGQGMSQNSFVRVGNKMRLQNGSGNAAGILNNSQQRANPGTNPSSTSPDEPDLLPAPGTVPPEPLPPNDSANPAGQAGDTAPERSI